MTEQPGWGAQQPAVPQYYRPPDHPSSTTVLILGILGVALCGLCAPFAWSMGNRVVREIDASQGQLGGRDQANIGRILGIVGSIILIGSLVLVGGMLLLNLAVVAGTAATS